MSSESQPHPNANSPDEPEPPSKGLWKVMGLTPGTDSARSPESAAPEKAVPAVDDETIAHAETPSRGKEIDTTSDTEPPPKSLWKLMQGEQPKSEPATDVEETVAADELVLAEAIDEPVATAADPPEPIELREREPVAASEPRQLETDEDEFEVDVEEDADWDDPSELEPNVLDAPPPLVVEPTYTAKVNRRRNGCSKIAVTSCVLGGLAVLTSGLAMLPEFWLKLPATVLGFAALVLGLMATGEIRRSRGGLTGNGLAVAGMVLGVIGMFLGPLLFSDVVLELRKDAKQEETTSLLEGPGTGLACITHSGRSGHTPQAGQLNDVLTVCFRQPNFAAGA